MDEFFQLATQQLGIDNDTARNATGGLLGMIKDQASGGDFSALLGALPGAEETMKAATTAKTADSGGGLLGNVMQMAGSALGGDAGKALNVASMLENFGLDLDKAGPFVSLFLNFIKGKAGSELIGKIMQQIPALQQSAG